MSSKPLKLIVMSGRGGFVDRVYGGEAELRGQGVGFTSRRGQLTWTCTLFEGGVAVAICRRGSWSDVRAAPTRRGTSNTNARGSSYDRAVRRLWLLTNYESDQGLGTCRCYRCGAVLDSQTVTVDRIIPGAKGGTYHRNNIRPACGRCNSETGGAVRR